MPGSKVVGLFYKYMAVFIASSPDPDGKISYDLLYRSVEALLEGESDLIANLANISAAIRQAGGWWWGGFYLVKEGLLGPSQGPVVYCL